jgi:uncharacterized protein YmfQ (DUF2313 family)
MTKVEMEYPCCEAVRRVEAVPGDATTLLGGWCRVHGLSRHTGPLAVGSLKRIAADARTMREHFKENDLKTANVWARLLDLEYCAGALAIALKEREEAVSDRRTNV